MHLFDVLSVLIGWEIHPSSWFESFSFVESWLCHSKAYVFAGMHRDEKRAGGMFAMGWTGSFVGLTLVCCMHWFALTQATALGLLLIRC